MKESRAESNPWDFR